MLRVIWGKAVGALLLFCAVGILALSGRSRDRERLKRLVAQLRFVSFVRDQIDRYLTPISEILRRADGEMIAQMTLGCEGGFADIEGLRALLRGGEYYSDGGAVFDSFLSSLGSSYREGELAGCDACFKELSAVMEKLSRELPRERKSRTVLSLCLAAALAIILI